MQLVDFLKKTARISTSVNAIIESDSGESLTYGQLWDRVDRFACELKNLGIESQDRVILILPNSIDWIVSFFSILKSGGVVVPIRQSATSSELKWIINKTKPTLFIGESSFINKSLPFDLLDDGKRVVVLGKKILVRTNGKRRINNLHDLMRGNSQVFLRDNRLVGDSDIATINFTYRGYGYPLGAMFNSSNYIAGIKAYSHTGGIDSPRRFLSVLPFGYMYPFLGCVLVPLATGSTIIVGRTNSLHKIWDTIFKWDVNVLTGIPSFYSALLNSSNGLDVDALRITQAFCGGSLLPVDLYHQAKELLNIPLRQGYGLTECMAITCNPPDDNRPGTLGKTLVGADGIDVKIFNEQGVKKPIGEIGEIVISGPTIMKGYFDMPTETSEVLKNGWLYTGDLGWFDEDGYLHFSGLRKRIAKVGGNMVDLKEVEKRMLGIPGISSVNVYTSPNARWGEVIAADIFTTSGPIDLKTIRHSLKRYLSTYKVPKILRNLS